jgi:acyl-CoA synthetase (AMP-forming)/AMP-acid ligase II
MYGLEAEESELAAASCRDRLTIDKCPKRIHIGEAIPRTATSMIQRRVVAQAYT